MNYVEKLVLLFVFLVFFIFIPIIAYCLIGGNESRQEEIRPIVNSNKNIRII
jgi:hypothetical protein